MAMTHVDGKDKGSLVLYTLSTCVWCRMMKSFLAKMDVGYDYVDVDTLEDEEKARVIDDLKRWNPKCSFPSLVVNGETCIIGFNEDTARKALGL
ncbi:MAG: glutaredoxin family protein [Syntrophorhabdaceae bacterium]|nr:glutaredoxin family protein [Syntrophorhabdaceae bacterium]